MRPGAPGNVTFDETPMPKPGLDEALVKVVAFSMNRGELGMASDPAANGRTIGWDFAGTIERAAVDGSSPPVGTRVAGWRPQMDAWAEFVACPNAYLARIPERVSDARAATLPVAGLTALAAIDKGSRLVGSRALVTGVTGGVGGFALQLARLSGAEPIALVRKLEQVEAARSLGASEVIVSEVGEGLEAHGPYRLVIDGVGGEMFGSLVRHVEKGGTLVSYGATGGPSTSMNIYPDLIGAGGQRSIYGLTLYTEVEHEPSAHGLTRILRLVESDLLTVEVAVQQSWSYAQEIAADLLARRFTGKAVLLVD